MVLLSSVIPIASASAEPCRLVGCANQVFYIFMPDANLTPETDAALILAGTHCKSPDSSQTFLRRGLPAVNEVATLKAEGRWVYTQQQLEEEIDLSSRWGLTGARPRIARSYGKRLTAAEASIQG